MYLTSVPVEFLIYNRIKHNDIFEDALNNNI